MRALFDIARGGKREPMRARGYAEICLRGPNGEPELLGALGAAPLPEIFLGYGKRDRYARASELLARRLPGACVTTVEGGHDWPTWSELWRIMLAQAFAE